MPPPISQSPRTARVFPGLLLLALVVYLSFIPLRPEAWGGPRGTGPFEDRPMPAAGWLARDVRIGIERFATARSPQTPLAATAEGLLGFHALLVAGRYVLLAWAVRRAGGSDAFALASTSAAFGIEALHGFRTDDANVGLILFAGLLAATARPSLSNRAIIGLGVWFVIWANAHASAVLGLGWLGVLACGRTVEWWRADGERPGRWWLAFVVCAVAGCANPDGPRWFIDSLTAAKNPNLRDLPDWQPIDFGTGAGRPYAYLVSVAGLLIVQFATARGFRPATLMLLLTFGVWPLVQQRGLGYWWLIGPWLVASYLGPMCTAKRLIRPSWGWAVWVGMALVVAPFVRWAISGQPRPMDRIVSADTPWQIAEELTASEYQGAIVCGEAQGDFLAWALESQQRVVVALYTRPESIDRDHWEEVRQVLNGGPDWWDVLDRQRANLVVIDRERFQGLANRLRRSAAWNVLQDEEKLFIAERRERRVP
jgi:hypothetical protein